MPDSKPLTRLPKPKPSNHPVEVGHRSEAAIVYELVRRGYRVLLPVGVNRRYDLVLDLDGEFVRAQCKTGRYKNGTVEFSTQSVRSNSKAAITRDYHGEAEIFLVYCPRIARIYSVPVAEASMGKMQLRLIPPKNHQAVGIHIAREYELPA